MIVNVLGPISKIQENKILCYPKNDSWHKQSHVKGGTETFEKNDHGIEELGSPICSILGGVDNFRLFLKPFSD